MRIALLPVLALLGACVATTRPIAPAADEVVEAGLAQTAFFGDLIVQPSAVIEDSRCPVDVECVWAGRLRLRVAISGMAGLQEMTLGQPIALPGGGTLLLVSARPERRQVPLPDANPNAPARFGFRREP